MTYAAINGARGACLPLIHHVGETTSAFDVAYDLINKGMLGEWDSVLAQSQTEGRGQMRKQWISPPGNLYAAIRLPQAEPFDSAPAAIAMGALLANALSSFGCRIMLKWPNDLILSRKNWLAKLGGILLEEKHGCIVAGIGINMLFAPGHLDEPRNLPAASLSQACNDELPGPVELWRALVKHIHSVYKNGVFFPHLWKDLAEELLLWRGEKVKVTDGAEIYHGIFTGLNDIGYALLDCDGKRCELMSGSMTPDQD